MVERRGFTLALLATLSLIQSTSVSAAELEFDPALARNPPEVEQASLQLLARPSTTANAIVRVRFEDQRRQTAIVINGGRARTLLRDDGVAPDDRAGDGLYAAFVKINAEQYPIEQRRRLDLAWRYKELPEFRNRELVRWLPFRPSPATRLRVDQPTVVDKFKGVPFPIDPGHELMITNVGVVEDPARTYDVCSGAGTQMGPWTFGRLMKEMANEPVTGMRPGDFVEHWLQEWTQDQTINTWNVTARPSAQAFIDAWPRLPDGQLDLAQAPFRLLAIVNRIDLRGNSAYGGSGAGEARFVFGFLDCDNALNSFGLPESTVILEYGIDKNGCVGVRGWAQQWQALGAMAVGSAAYNAALQAITDQFTLANARPGQLPNRSAINQVRTNEIIFFFSGEAHWELRESRLPALCSRCSGFLEHGTIAQTPNFTQQFSVTLRNFINAKEADILDGSHFVPLSYGGGPFRGGAVQPGAGFAWNSAGILNPEARHAFSLATCSACHTVETGTNFVHIENREVGAAAQLSDFLTGNNMPKTDPVTGVDRYFHDLLDRQAKLDAAANLSCLASDDFAVEELFGPHLPPAFVH